MSLSLISHCNVIQQQSFISLLAYMLAICRHRACAGAGLEYDLNLFNIVAVSDFNMGAMENKSLNIFNSRLVIASPATSTDLDFARVEGVVAHEYFHKRALAATLWVLLGWNMVAVMEPLTVLLNERHAFPLRSCIL